MMNNSYWNPDNEDFKISCNGKIYVDKSMLIDYTNSILHTPERFICVSRPRRFGKSTDANMLVAYYSKGCDSKALFDHLKIAHRDSYKKHLNKHHVIYLNMQSFVSNQENIQEMIKFLTSQVILELKTEISDVQFQDETKLRLCLEDIYRYKGEKFVFIIDEWDCIFREFPNDLNSQKVYLDFLRDLLKDKKYVSLAYMTGILPIKKYGTHSALNMFKEISMINPTPMEKFMGFTKEEVKKLCEEYQIDFDEMKAWYDGYHLNKEVSILSPRSVVFSLMDRKFKNYWASTETYESLKVYIDMNFDGLRDDIIKLLARKRVIINPSKFQNDMTTFQSKDDVFTLLVHLGYLGYDEETSEVYIPNNEVVESFVNSIEDSNW
ncbi:AAA family ATPase [Absiella sp. AM09-45]|nr:AAA family ATPase [Absiella sp. AM09-45]